jgi:hypothetical protein
LLYGEIFWTKLNKIMILPCFPYKSLDFILNTIKPSSDHETRCLGPTQQNLKKPLLGGNLNFKIQNKQDIKLAQVGGGFAWQAGNCLLLFHVLWLFIGKNMFWARKKIMPICGKLKSDILHNTYCITIKNRMISSFQLCFLQFVQASILFQG